MAAYTSIFECPRFHVVLCLLDNDSDVMCSILFWRAEEGGYDSLCNCTVSNFCIDPFHA